MRVAKLLCPAVFVALVVPAFAGPGMASAQKHLVVLCSENPGAKLCPAGKLLKSGTLVLSSLELFNEDLHAVFLSEELLGNELCEESNFWVSINHTSPLHGEVQSAGWIFRHGCKPCTTVTAENTPYLVEFFHEAVTSDHLWSLHIKSTQSKFPITMTFSGCPFGLTCKFEAKEITLDANNRAVTPLILTLKNTLTKVITSGALCPASVQLDANYAVSLPAPSFFALDEKEEL